MEKKKQKTEYEENLGEYRTGATQPPKTHGGLIAVLLILVIFLGGISSVLGLMNIQLFRQLNQLEEQGISPVCFTDQDEQTMPVRAQQGTGVSLGFSGKEVPYFWQMYRKLPQGIYISAVEDGSAAQNLGIIPGDILLSFDGQRLTETAMLKTILENKVPGDSVSMLLWRDGKQFPVTLILEAAIPAQNG